MPPNGPRRFGVIVSDIDEAQRFLDRFSRKLGTLDGSPCRCSETSTYPDSAGILVTVLLTPWNLPIDPDDAVSFDKLIRETGATEITA